MTAKVWLTPYFVGQIRYELAPGAVKRCPANHVTASHPNIRFCSECGQRLIPDDHNKLIERQFQPEVARVIAGKLGALRGICGLPYTRSPKIAVIDQLPDAEGFFGSNLTRVWMLASAGGFSALLPGISDYPAELNLREGSSYLDLQMLNMDKLLDEFIEKYEGLLKALAEFYYGHRDLRRLRSSNRILFGILTEGI